MLCLVTELSDTGLRNVVFFLAFLVVSKRLQAPEWVWGESRFNSPQQPYRIDGWLRQRRWRWLPPAAATATVGADAPIQSGKTAFLIVFLSFFP